MNLPEVLKLKSSGILNLDNLVVVNWFSDEEIQTLKDYIEEKYNYQCQVVELNLDIVPGDSFETTLVSFTLQLQKLRDKIVSSNDFFIFKDFYQFYKNDLTPLVEKSNPQYLIWYLSYTPTFNPIMFINKNENASHYGLVNIFNENGKSLISNFERGLEEIGKIYKEYVNQKKKKS